jgi:hypothetical protein
MVLRLTDWREAEYHDARKVPVDLLA